MNHTMQSALIVSALLLLFIIPVYFIFRRDQKTRKAQLNERLNAAILSNHLSLTRAEFVGNKMIGWDQQNKMMLFTQQNDTEVTLNDLSSASGSYILKSMNGSSVRSVILQIVDSRNALVCSIPFYQQFSDNEMKLKIFEQQAKDWEQLLNSHLVK
jgi:cbb3-type cytochrome oxidase subunit 3